MWRHKLWRHTSVTHECLPLVQKLDSTVHQLTYGHVTWRQHSVLPTCGVLIYKVCSTERRPWVKHFLQPSKHQGNSLVSKWNQQSFTFYDKIHRSRLFCICTMFGSQLPTHKILAGTFFYGCWDTLSRWNDCPFEQPVLAHARYKTIERSQTVCLDNR